MEQQQPAAISLFLLGLTIFLATLTARAAARSPAVFVFGDSTVDVGNNNFLPIDAPKANFFPYGIDYPGRIPTGRFGNGFLGVDFIAEAAGSEMSPPSFLSLSNAVQARRGVNFASAGSGVLDTVGKDVVTMNQQIKDFSTVAGNLTAITGSRFASAYLKESLFYVSVGSNDLFDYADVIDIRNSTQKDEIVAYIIGQFKDQLQCLYDLGARKFAVFGTGLIGCIPDVRRMTPAAECDSELNDLSLRYKTATRAVLEQLGEALEGFKYSFSDFYDMGNLILSNPHRYGFTEVRAACCGSGTLNAEGPCAPNATYCSNRNHYAFWDSIHPTQAVYRVAARLSLYGPPQFAYPVNIQSLLKKTIPPKRNERPPVMPTPDDDSAPTVRPTRRETRGTHFDRLRRQIEERGKLPITFCKSDGHLIGSNAASFITELGLLIKKFASLQAKSWKNVPEENKRMIYDRLSAAFDISFEEEATSVRKETDRLMSARYRDNRNKIHTYYKSLLYLPPSERRHHMPIEFCETQEDWNYMCDLFESENFQTRSTKNTQNRSQLPYNHRGGSKSFIQYSYDGTDQSQRKDWITVFNTTHCSSSKGWIRERAECAYGDMVRLCDEYIQSQETRDDIYVVQIADQVCDQVIGVRSGYIRGLGSGPKLVRSTSSDTTSSSRVTNAALHQKLESTQEELANTRVQLASIQDELTSMRSRQDMFEVILNRLAPGALQSLIHESSSASPTPPYQS